MEMIATHVNSTIWIRPARTAGIANKPVPLRSGDAPGAYARRMNDKGAVQPNFKPEDTQ